MSCSQENTNKYLISKNLVKPSLELYTELPSRRLLQTIDSLTSRAKSKYGVDNGPLYQIKYRNIEIGNYLTLGSGSTVTKSRLEPNEGAFEAIDKSDTQRVMSEDYQREQLRMEKQREIIEEQQSIQKEGSYVVSDGEIQVPKDFPQITIKCV